MKRIRMMKQSQKSDTQAENGGKHRPFGIDSPEVPAPAARFRIRTGLKGGPNIANIH
jgi:hypothetical protein